MKNPRNPYGRSPVYWYQLNNHLEEVVFDHSPDLFQHTEQFALERGIDAKALVNKIQERFPEVRDDRGLHLTLIGSDEMPDEEYEGEIQL